MTALPSHLSENLAVTAVSEKSSPLAVVNPSELTSGLEHRPGYMIMTLLFSRGGGGAVGGAGAGAAQGRMIDSLPSVEISVGLSACSAGAYGRWGAARGGYQLHACGPSSPSHKRHPKIKGNRKGKLRLLAEDGAATCSPSPTFNSCRRAMGYHSQTAARAMSLGVREGWAA